MRKIQLLMLTLIVSIICIPCKAQMSFGQSELFNSDWRFTLGDNAEFSKMDLDDQKWRKLDLPHDWSIEGTLSPDQASCTGYLPGGIGWYRKHFTVSKSSEEKYYIYFEGVYNRSTVWVNGHELGYRPNGYVSFGYELSDYLVEGENVIAVRVDHSRSADSRWYTGSGIYRDVYLVKAGKTHFAQWSNSWKLKEISEKSATVEFGWEVSGEDGKYELEIAVSDKDGKTVSKTKKKITVNSKQAEGKVQLTIKNPIRWDLNTPYLYDYSYTLYSGNKVIDYSADKLGLRTIRFDANKGFFLNDNNIKIKGVCIHHDGGALGAAVPEDVWERRLLRLKEIGVNAIRTAHNPQAPIVYSICDKIGLMVMDEISDEWEFPKRKWIKGWNVGTPGYQGSFDFFEEWIEKDAEDMVRRDRNHASIILWSIGNEVDYPNDPYSHPILDGSTINQPMYGGYKKDAPDAMRIGVIAQKLAAVVKAVDDSRPTTGALAGVVMSNETAYPQAVDVVGYNYTENRYDLDHKLYPDRIIYGSENSAGYSQWKAVTERDFISGQFIWTGIDYLGESHEWPSRGMYTGLINFSADNKPRGWFRASLWSEKPMTYIGTYPAPEEESSLSAQAWDSWNYKEGQLIQVVCYTNAPYARLLLNGKEIGETKAYDPSNGIIGWVVPYSDGELKAEGCDENGKVLSTYTIRTSGRPYALKVCADKEGFTSERSVIHLNVEVVDENGIPVVLADNKVECTIEGPAELLALEASDNTDMGDYSDNVQRVYRGKLLAYIVPKKGEGEIKVRFSSPLLKDCEITLKSLE